MASASNSAAAAPPSRRARAASETPAAAIATLDGQLERTPVARPGSHAVAADQRAIGEKVMREMRGAQIVLALRIRERFARHRLDDVELADTDQHLHEAD